MTAQAARHDAPRDIPVRRNHPDTGSVLQALEGLTPPPSRPQPPPPPRRASPALLPARRPEKKRPDPGTGIIDVRALAGSASHPVVARPAPASPRPAATVIVAHSLLHSVKPPPAPRPVPPPPTTPEPASVMSPMLAFLCGALLGTGLLTASLLVGAT